MIQLQKFKTLVELFAYFDNEQVCRDYFSSLQLHRDIGVTQKTAWYLLHRVRHSLGLQNDEKLTGTIEADETFMGGNEKNKHTSKKTDNNQGRPE